MNESLLAKIAWKIIKGTDFGFNLLQNKYLDSCRHPKTVRTISPVSLSTRKALSDLSSDVFCSIGDGSSVLFWWDDWLGYRISERLFIPSYLQPFLSQTVSDYFFDGMWHFTEDFVTRHTAVVLDILKLPLGEQEDIRFWKPSLTGDVSAALVYQNKCPRALKVNWGTWIWAHFLPVRRSIICWRAIRGRLPTYDTLMRCGFCGPNICMLCFRNMESIDHIFWDCEVARAVWKGLLDWFGIPELPHCYDFNSFIIFAMGVSFSQQFSNLWKFGVVSSVWAIWNERNMCSFEGKTAAPISILSFIKAALREVASIFQMGSCLNIWKDYQLGRSIGINCRFAVPPTMVTVTWWPPLPSWIKVNTDGSALGSPGSIFAGGVFRDASGSVRGCFHVNGGRGFAFEAEILGAITAIEIAYLRGWLHLWLETDSTYVALLLHRKSLSVPWRFANIWRRALSYIELMDFRVSHIFREGNQVADILAHKDTPEGWWPFSIPLITHAVARDMSSPRFYRVV